MTRFAVSLKTVIVAVAVFLFVSSDATAEITITNATAKSLSYRIRFPGKNWSKSYNIDPSQTHNFPTKQKLEVQTENGGEQRSWTLEADNDYEYAIKSNETKASFYSLTERTAALSSPTTADTPRSDFPNRELTIKVMADQTYRDRHPEWNERIRQIVASASQYYEKYFNIRLSVLDIQPWAFSASPGGYEEMLEGLYKIDPEDNDIILGFFGEKLSIDQSRQRHLLGSTINFGQHVHVSDSMGRGDAVRVVVHEIGHVLGAFHVNDRRSIMYPDSSQTATYFEFGKIVNTVFEQAKSLV